MAAVRVCVLRGDSAVAPPPKDETATVLYCLVYGFRMVIREGTVGGGGRSSASHIIDHRRSPCLGHSPRSRVTVGFGGAARYSCVLYYYYSIALKTTV